jgi:hypothetical protein
MDFLILFQAIRKGPKELSYWHQLAPFLNRIILAIIPVMSIADKAGGDMAWILVFANLQNFTKFLEFFNFQKFLFFHKIFILFFDIWHKICNKINNVRTIKIFFKLQNF